MTVVRVPAASVDDTGARYRPLNPDTRLLSAGSRLRRGALRLPVDIINERDVPLQLRDGTMIYADVYRPAGDEPVPAIVNWSPYGKGHTGYWDLDNGEEFPNRFGIGRSRLSGLHSWEANDPAYWCAHGYAIVQVDPRGVFNSEGDVWFLSKEEGEDGADAIEEIAALPWCSGSVGLSGNSWLAMSQWRIASERPPHLKAIAPWEGLIDPYRDDVSRGGVPNRPFPAHVRDHIYGHGQVEDIVGALDVHPLVDDYWTRKIPQIGLIDVPAYVVASYTNPVHDTGTLHAWAQLRSPKWLRIHNTQEWPDYYDPGNVEDLRRFFDRFLRGEENDWESTPTVRMAVLNPGGHDEVGRAATSFPPVTSVPTTLPLTIAGSDNYRVSESGAHVDLTWTAPKDCEIFGVPLLTFWMTTDRDDADIYIRMQKLDQRGRPRWHQTVDLGLPLGRKWMPIAHALGVKALANAFFAGPRGVLRLSRRGLDPDAPATSPRLALTTERRLTPREPVMVAIPLSPVGMLIHAGETVRIRVTPKSLIGPLLPKLSVEAVQPDARHRLIVDAAHPASLGVAIAPAAG